MRHALLLASWCLACTPRPEPAPPANAVGADEAPVAPADRRVVLGDIDHLLAKGLGAAELGALDEAGRRWSEAYSAYREHLLEAHRAHDAQAALETEFSFGRVRRAMMTGRGLKAAADDLRGRLRALRDLPVPPPTPTDPATPPDALP